MFHIPRRPHAVQVKATRSDYAVGELLEKDLALHQLVGAIRSLATHECPNITVSLPVLNLLELLNQVIGALLETLIACGSIHVTHRREIVSGNMTGQISSRAVPTAIAFGGPWFQPGIFTQII